MRLRIRELPEPAEPAVRENVAGTIRRPARWIHFAMRTDRHFAAPFLQIANQLVAGLKLGAGGLVAVEIAHETNAEPDVVHIIAVDMSAPNLVRPAVPDFDLAITCRGPISDYKMIGQPIPHPPHMPVIIIKNPRTPLSGTAVMDDDEFPAPPLHRRPPNCLNVRTR